MLLEVLIFRFKVEDTRTAFSRVHEIPSKRNAKVETTKASITDNDFIERYFTTLLVRPLGLGRGRRGIHVFSRISAFEAAQSINTDRALLSTKANLARNIVKCSASALDVNRLYGVSFTEPLFGDIGVHDGCQEIHQILSRNGRQKSTLSIIA